MILEVARQLCVDLGIPSAAPESLVWAALVPKDTLDGSTRQAGKFVRIAASDQCRFVSGAMLIPADMRGKLAPEEWRPLVASSLIFRWKLRWRLLLRKVVFDWSSLGLAMLAVFYAIYIAFALRALSLAIAFLAVPVAIFLLGQAAYNKSHKGILLSADLQAAKIVGSNSFAEVLRKIDSFHTEDVEWIERRGKLRRFLTTDRPAIDERIENLMVTHGRGSDQVR